MKNRIELCLPINSETLREELPEGFQIHDEGIKYFEFDDTGFSLFNYTLEWIGNASAGVIASLIFAAIKKRSSKPTSKIIINETQIMVDREQITKVIQRSIEVQDGHEKDQ